MESTHRMLCIEACTDIASVALFEGDDLLVETVLRDPDRKHSESLLPAIDLIMSAAKWTPGDLDAVAATRGPGAFTSIRICLSTAWGIARGQDIPLYTTGTLEALAMSTARNHQDMTPAKELKVLCLLDARRNQVYGGVYDLTHTDAPRPPFAVIMEPEVGDVTDIAARAMELTGGDVWAVGKGAREYREILESAGVKVPEVMALHRLRSASLGRYIMGLTPQQREENRRMTPVYLRKSQAEREAELR